MRHLNGQDTIVRLIFVALNQVDQAYISKIFADMLRKRDKIIHRNIDSLIHIGVGIDQHAHAGLFVAAPHAKYVVAKRTHM